MKLSKYTNTQTPPPLKYKYIAYILSHKHTHNTERSTTSIQASSLAVTVVKYKCLPFYLLHTSSLAMACFKGFIIN